MSLNRGEKIGYRHIKLIGGQSEHARMKSSKSQSEATSLLSLVFVFLKKNGKQLRNNQYNNRLITREAGFGYTANGNKHETVPKTSVVRPRGSQTGPGENDGVQCCHNFRSPRLL